MLKVTVTLLHCKSTFEGLVKEIETGVFKKFDTNNNQDNITNTTITTLYNVKRKHLTHHFLLLTHGTIHG